MKRTLLSRLSVHPNSHCFFHAILSLLRWSAAKRPDCLYLMVQSYSCCFIIVACRWEVCPTFLKNLWQKPKKRESNFQAGLNLFRCFCELRKIETHQYKSKKFLEVQFKESFKANLNPTQVSCKTWARFLTGTCSFNVFLKFDSR